MSILKKFRLLLIAAFLYGMFFIFKRDIFFSAVDMTGKFFLEMVRVLPPVLVITALISVWIPSSVIIRGLGHASGIRGKLISLIIGSLSAGPIYAAFPATLVLFRKGASVSNLVIILSTWAVVKVPMILVEISFLGLKFAITRLVLTVPAILIMGYLVEKLVPRKSIVENSQSPEGSFRDVLSRLPQMNCGACAYSDCRSFAEGVLSGDVTLRDCVILERQNLKSS